MQAKSRLPVEMRAPAGQPMAANGGREGEA